jgi:hypothetical protein
MAHKHLEQNLFPISMEKRETPRPEGKSQELVRVKEHLYQPVMFPPDLPIASI